MKVKTLALGAILSFLNFSAFAVDGYKGVKFGSNVNTVLKANWCGLKKYEGGDTAGLTSYYCNDFKFSGSQTTAMAIFLDGKFERLAIILKDGGVVPLMQALEKKYGEPSYRTSKEDMENVMNRGGTMSIKYDANTVSVNGSRSSETKTDTFQLHYSSIDYDAKLEKIQSRGLDGDI